MVWTCPKNGRQGVSQTTAGVDVIGKEEHQELGG
jgi:hypothetical protein